MRTMLPNAALDRTAAISQSLGLCALFAASCALAEEAAKTEFRKYAEKVRAEALRPIEPKVGVPTTPRPRVPREFPWKLNLVAGVFTIRGASAWDPEWEKHYGGFDDPSREARKGLSPAKFQPGLNPFYVALPYNDVGPDGTKTEARSLVPWFADAFERDGKSVLRDRWVMIRKNLPNSPSKICYAQWSDCGPFVPDQGEYVFGNALPRWNAKKGQGLSVSPAVRDFLQMWEMDVLDWRFVESDQVPAGPWAELGANNPLAVKPSVAGAATEPK
jgi:hypothetical protein